VKAPLNLLISFAEGASNVEKLLGNPEWRVLVDSGAFANFNNGKEVVSKEAYAEFLKGAAGRKAWRYFSMDVIADPERSRVNFEWMRAQGLSPVPVFQRGGKIGELRQLLHDHELVAIGGVAAKLAGDLDYIHQVMDVAREARSKVHLLGVGVTKVFYRYRPFSADSSTYCSRHGFVRFWDPMNARLAVLRLHHGEAKVDMVPVRNCRSDFARLCDEYGIDPDEALKRPFYTSYRARVINLRSFMRYQATLRTLGTEYFIAMSIGDVDTALPDAWALEREAA
jgi:hypothetical protein